MMYNIATPDFCGPLTTKPVLVAASNTEEEQESYCALRSHFSNLAP